MTTRRPETSCRKPHRREATKTTTAPQPRTRATTKARAKPVANTLQKAGAGVTPPLASLHQEEEEIKEGVTKKNTKKAAERANLSRAPRQGVPKRYLFLLEGI